MLFNFQTFVDFPDIFLLLISTLILLSLQKIDFSPFNFLEIYFMAQNIWSVLVNVSCTCDMYSAVIEWNILQMSIRLSWLIVLREF